MIDHVILNVKNLASSRKFYEAALEPLGYSVIMSSPQGVGFGDAGKPDFWIALREPGNTGVHVAFGSRSRNRVKEFHQAALKAGGVDNGPPGIREHYHKDYYGAFVLDPDGNNIEVVCHQPEE